MNLKHIAENLIATHELSAREITNEFGNVMDYAISHHGEDIAHLSEDKYGFHLEILDNYPQYLSLAVRACEGNSAIGIVRQLSIPKFARSDELAEVCSELEFLANEVCSLSPDDMGSRLFDLLTKLENLQC